MFEKHASGKAALVADIDDNSVGVSIVEIHKSGPASIVKGERMMLPLESREANQSASAVLQLLEQCVDKVVKAYTAPDEHGASNAPAAVYCVLRAPWTHFRTARLEESFPESQIITKELISERANKALSTIEGLDASNALESGVMQVFLNGYPTGQPIGKRARTVGVVAFKSDVMAEMKRGVIEVFGKLLPGRDPAIRSGSHSLLTVLHEHVPDIQRYCILDVSGSATNCSVVRHEMVTQNEEVHEGTTTILRRIAGPGLPEETLAQLRMLIAGTCSSDACKRLQDTLAKAEPELVKIYGDMFGKLAEKRRLPNRAILVAPVDLAPWLQGFFSRIDFAQFTATTQPLEIETLLPDHLQESAVWKTGVSYDTEMALSAAYVNVLEHAAS